MVKHYKSIIKKYKKNLPYYLFRYNRIFFGSLISRGRKIWAFNFMLKLKYKLKIKEQFDPHWIFFFAMIKLTPNVLLFPYKLGGKLQGVPLPISLNKKLTYATKWVIKLLRDKYRKLILSDLVNVLVGALYNKELSYKKKMKSYNEGFENRFLIKYFK